MIIEIKKATLYKSEYKIIRDDQSVELIKLDTKTFFIHDICHYVVEKNLPWEKGFWGMLANGYKFKELFGKENALTTELRFIEKIVGPIQSVHMGHFKKEQFNEFTEHLDFEISESTVDSCLSEIEEIVKSWQKLNVGEQLTLEWKL